MIAGWIAAAAPALAYVGAPDRSQIAEAAGLGARLATPYRGYPADGYLLYAVADALALKPDDGCVDAVQVATPFERTRHAAFLAALQGRTIAPEAARRAADLPDNSLEIIVFSHGTTADDEDFLHRFGAPTLTFEADRRAPPVSTTPSPAFPDSYPHADAIEKRRYVGTVAFRFALDQIAASSSQGVVSFSDACGKAFRLPLDLNRYR